MLFTAGTRWLAPRAVAEPEAVTVHEAGHQFWYGIVATNEFEHAWMDEGLNTFSTARALEQFFGPQYFAKRYFGGFVPWVFDDIPLSRATDGNYLERLPRRRRRRRRSRRRPGGTGPARLAPSPTTRPRCGCTRSSGCSAGRRCSGSCRPTSARYAFKHPQPEDFFAVVNEVSGRDLTWFFDQVYRSSNVFDYARRVVHERARGGPRLLRRREPPDVLGRASVRRSSIARRWSCAATATASSRSTCASSSRTARKRAGSGTDASAGSVRGRPAGARRERQVDPERVLLLDVELHQQHANARAADEAAAARKWSLTWLIWLQDHLLTYGFFI